MHSIEVFLVDAFTANSRGGNTAGVVWDADPLSDDDKLAIAKKVAVIKSNPNPLITEITAAIRKTSFKFISPPLYKDRSYIIISMIVERRIM